MTLHDAAGGDDRTGIWQAGNTPASPAAGTDRRRLTAGAIINDRYRVIERLGGGSMGEVYRAEDLRLSQDVALKFLALEHARPQDHAALLNEIRLARRVTHPNVCRVHDLGEFAGAPFVSMEYVRGEDLGNLLRRVGALHGERGLAMARQICAGVQAAHEQGVLHRDLKPANILVDHNGSVRITDFGIAAAAEQGADQDAAGSPAYMAPELLTGAGTATVASDVYALGLVLFELFTGRRLFQADSMTTLLEQHRRPVPPPSQFVPQLDRQVESAVLACLRRDPEQRPPSALAVLVELPGGDPLAEALAAGQTPSPTLIAAASGSKTLSRTRRALLAALTLVMFALVAWFDPAVKLLARTPLPLSDAVLVDRAHAHVRVLSGGLDFAATAHGFAVARGELQRLSERGLTAAQWQEILHAERGRLITFWWRGAQHAAELMPHNVKGRVRWDDPAHAAPGMVRVQLDPAGRLQRYAGKPDGRQRRGAPPLDAEVFALAGLDLSAFTATAPALVPDAYADERAAWQTADGSARVELARLSGFPVQFEHFAVSAPPRSEDVRAPSVRFAARVVLLLIAGALAWQAVSRRQADGAGAARIGLTLLLLVAMFTVLTGDHGGSWGGVGSLTLEGLSHGLAVACELVLYYLALEPHARRIWPRTMTSWSRLLAGRWRDPQVAAAVVAGAFAGTVTALLHHELPLVQRAFGVAECSPVVGLDHDLESLAGLGPALGVFCEIVVDVMRQGMMTFVALVALRLLLRRQGLVLIAAVALWTASREYGDVGPAWIEAVSAATTIVSATLVVVVAIRFGLLALIVGALVHALALSFPMRPDLSVWYSTITLLPAVALVLLLLAAVFLPRERRLLAA